MSAEPFGDPTVEASLMLERPALEHGAGGATVSFVLRNRTAAGLRFEFCVQAYARSGISLSDGRTAWSLLSLGPNEARPVKTADLPACTESWRLIARWPSSR